MAHVSHPAENSAFDQVRASIGNVFRAIGTALTVNASAEARLREVNRLQGLSDQDLAKMGLARENIVRHVFRDFYMI